MSSPKGEPQGNGFTRSSNTQSSKRNRPDGSSDSSFEPVTSQSRLLSRESLTSTPAFKKEPSPFRTFSFRTLSPQNVVKLPPLVSFVGTELAVKERNERHSFVTPVKTTQHSNIGQFNVEHEKEFTFTKEKTKTWKECNPSCKPLTGNEVVEILAKKKHLGEHDVYYLKMSTDGPYRPYDLRVVSRSAAGTDYYIFSPTTIIHMQDGCCIELWTLAEWYREAVLCEAVRNIPFFRDCLLRKTFQRWHRNVHKVTVKRRIDLLPSQLLIAVPQFRNVLLHLTRLLEELKQVNWLPQDDSRTYTLVDFQAALLEKNQTAQDSLVRFLHCRSAVLNMVKDQSYQMHQDLQMEVEHSKPYQNSQSLHLQLNYLRNLQGELSQAEHAIQRLGNLAALADHMTVQNLVTISKQEITTFLNNVVKREQKQQGGLFQAEIVFGANGQLSVFPPLHLFQELLLKAVLSVADSILQVFDSCSLPCDSKGSLPTRCVEDIFAGTHQEFKAKGCEVTGPDSASSQKECDIPPQTVLPVKINSLRVQAQRVRGHYQFVPQRLLEWNLKVHIKTQEIQNEQDRITQDAITEVLQLCESHSWLTDVHMFTSQWSSVSLKILHGCSPLKYEELIKKLHFWNDRVHSMPQFFTTSNKLFTVKISRIQKDTGSMLNTIDKDMQRVLCEDLQIRSQKLFSKLKSAVEVMESEPNTFHKFTDFSNMIKCSERTSGDMQQQLEDLHSLQESLRRNFTHLAPIEILSLKEVVDLWNHFVPLLKQAAGIVTQQLPSMLDTLHSRVSSLVIKLDNLASTATSGPYLDPDQNAKEMTVQLEALCGQFYVIAEQLNDQSRASEILNDHLLDLTFVTVAQQNIEARKGLWELMSMSSSQIQEWKLQHFRKFVVAKAQDKVSAWIQQAKEFAKVIPSHDALLEKITQILQGFNHLLPVLSTLSSPTLKYKHWKNISKGIDLLYNPEWKLTVADLMSKDLLRHQNKINKIYLDAKAKTDMEQTFQVVQRYWEAAEFHHTRFIIAVQQEQNTQLGDVTHQNVPKQDISDGETFIIIGLETLLAQTKESILTLSGMLSSPLVADIQKEVENWWLLLQEQDELLYIFEQYQQKWIFLSRTFNETVHTQMFELQEKFHPVDKMFREIIEITVNDPHVSHFVQLSATTESRDSFQGQTLHAVFMNGLTTMEEISNHILYVLESPRRQFPRLYCLSDGEVMKLLSLQLPAPSSLLPLVQKCFKGVKKLDVQVEGDVCSEHDLTALSNERMWVRGVYGQFGEYVPFICPLKSDLSPVAWFCLFEQKLYQAMKQTVIKCFAVLQHSKLDKLPSNLDLIGNNKGNSTEAAQEAPSLMKLISQYPLQCILVAEEILWSCMIQQSSNCITAGMWMRLKSQKAARLHYLWQLMKEHCADSNEEQSQQILTALRALIMLTMKHSSQADGLVEVKRDLESSFEWKKLMKYCLVPNANGVASDLLSQKDQSVCVDILCTRLAYGYEYIGPEKWTMVTTPSTEQAYMGIILALTNFKCAFISGPHMSGKQHAAMQLGYALGRLVVILKCCSSTGSSVVSQMLLGALQNGAWLVLDSVDSLGQGTLSELGQHLNEIHQHLSAVQRQAQEERRELYTFGSGEFIKEDNNTVNKVECHIAGKNNISVKLTYGCITVSANGYSTEIPENLRVAMRPVTLMKPHYRVIAEVMLASFGFSEAATIGRRLDCLFSLAKDSDCLPDFLSGHQTSWLVLLKNVIAASGIHLSRHLKENDNWTFSCQNRYGSSSKTRLETMPDGVEEHYSSHFKFANQCNSIINEELEEQAVIKGVLSVMQFTVSDPKRASQFQTLFEEIFPKVRYFRNLQHLIDEGEQIALRNAATDELLHQGFYLDTQMLHNVLILYQALKFSNVVMLIGPAGSGKTTLYQALASALQKWAKALEIESAGDPKGDFKNHDLYIPCWTPMSTDVILPNTLSHEQFFGGYFDKDNSWYDGVFTKALKQSKQLLPITPSKRNKTVQIQQVKWIVLDGDPFGRPSWLDSLTTLCDLEDPHLYLSSGEKIEPLRLKILAEITNLGDSTPSVVTHCSLVYISGENLWRSVWKREMDVLSCEHNVDKITLDMWSLISEDLFPDTIAFLKNNVHSPVMASDGRQSSRIIDGLQEIMSFIKILHTLLEHSGKEEGLKYTSKKTETTDNTQCTEAMPPSTQWELQARNLFIVAYIWGFGGHLDPRYWPHFDIFAREALHKSHCKVQTPPEHTVFEHFFEFSEEMRDTTNFINFSTRKSPQLFFSSVPQYETHAYLLDMLLDAHQPVLLVGESGSGKTVLCKSLISHARPHIHLPASPGLHPSELCKTLKKVRHQNTQLNNMKVLKKPDLLLFIDDLHEAPFDTNGKTSVTLETLRQCISRGEVLTSDGPHFKLFQSRTINYLGTCSVPKAGHSNWISPRLSRLFIILALPSMTSEILFSIHSSKLQQWLNEIQPMQKIADRTKCIITSTVEVYFAVRECFSAASCSPNFIFSLHDIHKVFQGMYLWRPRLDVQQVRQSSLGFKNYSSTEKTVFFPSALGHGLNITRLWMHECLRTFGDRLDSEETSQKLISIITEVSEKNFGTLLSAESQTLPEDTPSPTDHNVNQKLDSTPSQLEKNVTPLLEIAEVQRARMSSLYSPRISEGRSKKVKDDVNFESEPGTSERKSQSAAESSSCSFQMLCSCSHSGENRNDYMNQNPASHEKLLQLLKITNSSIQNVVFSPELCKPLNSILQHHNFKRTCVYQERDFDVLVGQLIQTIKSREENKHKKSDDINCSSTWAVHHQNVHQLVHIIRAFLIPGGHGALFGAAKKTGRKTIVRLAAALTGYQLIEVHPGNEAKMWEMMKDVWSRTRVDAGHLVLLVHENTSQAVKDQLLVVMANGSLPGLYSEEELKNLTLRMKTWMKNSQCHLKDDQALEMFFKTIQRNTHVFMLYTLLPDNCEKQTRKSAVMEMHITKALSLCCCVEVYQPWTSESLVESALYHLKTNQQIPKTDVASDSISKAMAGIHLSATKYAATMLHFHPFGPRSYIELMVQFFFLCRHLFEKSRGQDNRLAKVLADVKVLTDTAAIHTQEVLTFRAKCEEKQKCLDQLQSEVDVAHKIWEQRCHQSVQEEEWLSNLQEQSHRVQQQVQDTFKQVNPLYQAALEALQALSQSDLDEMRHYRMPPDGVVMVMDIICMLFNRPCGWDNSRQLLVQSSFFQELEFFDCSKLTDETIQKLGHIIQAPSFQPNSVRDVSRACESLCLWVRAVYQYACIQRRMAPQQAKKRNLDDLMAESRVRMKAARLQEESERERLEELERQQELNRQDMELLKAQLSSTEAQEMESCAALKLLECHIKDWMSEVKEAKLANRSIQGDALILAAAVTYLGPFRPDVRQELLLKWHKLCLTGEINMKPEDPRATLFNDVFLTAYDYYVAIPTSKTFQSGLNQIFGLDMHRIHRDSSVLVRSVLLWGNTVAWAQRCPLLADHHDEEYSYQTMFPSDQLEGEEKVQDKYGLIISADDKELLDKLNHGAKEGLRVLVTHVERVISNLQIIQGFVTPGSHPEMSTHPDFHLVMSTCLPVQTLIQEIPPSFLEEVQMIDLSPSTSEVQDIILTELMQTECSALWTLHNQIQTKKQTLQHKLLLNKFSLMEYAVYASKPLLQDPEFFLQVYTCQSVSLQLETEIKKLSQEMDQHKPLMTDFYQIAELTTSLYNALQDVARLSPCYLFTLHSFLLTLRSALALESPDVRFHVRCEMEPRAVISEITYRIVSHVFSQYKPRLFQSHSALFRLLVSVAIIVHNEGCPEVERVTFLRGLSNWKSSEHFLSPSTQSIPELPSWIQTESPDDVYLLEMIAPFRGLVSSLVNSSKLWREYLCYPSSTVIGAVPCQSHSHLSTMQRAILWKTLYPHLLVALEEDLAVCARGYVVHSYAGVTSFGSAEIVSKLLSKNEGPIVISLPEVQVGIHPLHLIKQVMQCQVNSKGLKLNVISFGPGCHRDAVLSALDSAVQNGHWLVLNNCHLLDCWDVTVVNELTQVVSCSTKDLKTHGELLLNGGSAGRLVHPQFRLWLINKGDRPDSVPAAVRIRALHLVCDSSWDLKDELWSSVKQTLPSFSPEDTLHIRCAILHTVLLQRQTFKHFGQGQCYFWTLEDLLALIHTHHFITKHCSDPAGALEYIAGHLVYGGHVSDHADLAAVQSVVRACLRQPSTLCGRGQHILSDIIDFTGKSEDEGLLKDLRHHMESINSGTVPILLGFTPGIADELMKLKSNTLKILLHQSQNIFVDVRGDTSLLIQPQELLDYRMAWERLLTLQDKLKKMDIGTGMESACLGPLRCFFQAEWERLEALVSSLLLDNFQPVKYNMTSSTAAYLTSSALSRLETRADLLRSYLWEESSSIAPHVYRLAAFFNPRGFLAALIREAAHIQNKDISLYRLHFKVLDNTASPSYPALSGVCLSGLELQGALWDPGPGVLKDTLSPKPFSFPPLWVSVEEGKGDRIHSSESSHCNSSSLPLYYCPLYVDIQTADGGQGLSDDNIITYVPLAAKMDPILCTMRRVRLTSSVLQQSL